MSCSNKEALTKAFNQVDTDKNGTIDARELENILMSYYKSTGKPCDAGKIKTDAQAFLRDVDKDHDNKINLKEFLEYFSQFC